MNVTNVGCELWTIIAIDIDHQLLQVKEFGLNGFLFTSLYSEN